MPKIRDIFIANTAEAFAELLQQSTSDDAMRQGRISHEIDLSQRGQFWGGDNKIIITPEPIPAALLESNIKRLGYNSIINLWPKESGLRLCALIAKDVDLVDKIIDYIRANSGIHISSYAVTEEYVSLVKMLQKETGYLDVTNLPNVENPARLVQMIDSKSGFRTIITNLFLNECVKLPDGYICKDKQEILKAALTLINANKGFVIKINNGESGWGTEIVDRATARLFDESRVTVWLDALFQSEPIWKFAPYIVEEFIAADTTIAGGFPSGEGRVTEAGFTFSYNCGQEVTKGGEFEGISIGASLSSFDEYIKTTLHTIGDKFHALGYRGVFDIDFVAGTDGNLYILECNARLTGGTHVYDVISYLKFSDVKNLYVFSKDLFQYGDVVRRPGEILQTFSLCGLLYPINNEKRGVLISFISSSRPVIGIIVVGKDQEDVRFLMEQMRCSLRAH